MAAFPSLPVYRPILKALHWAAFALVVAMLIAPVRPLEWALAGVVAIWAICFGAYGIVGRPGPKLTGPLRTAFVPLHIMLMVVLGITALIVLTHSGELERRLLIAMLGLGLLHGIFHAWRHTVLGDNALRKMAPKAMHGWL